MNFDLKNYYNIFLLSLYCFVILSCNRNEEFPKLSGRYMLWANWKMISSDYYRVIYPVVTDYAFNKEFILAEQHPRKDDLRMNLGEHLFRRFENYQLYVNDPNILKDSFYNHLKGLVEKDSTLYRNFIHHGALNNESKNREISIHMAEDMIENDSYYKKVLSNKINYWIICNSSDTIIGPLTQQEYLNKKVALNIPINLKLDFEKQD